MYQIQNNFKANPNPNSTCYEKAKALRTFKFLFPTQIFGHYKNEQQARHQSPE